MDPVTTEPTDDPVLERRASIARAVDIGKRIGYSLFGVAIVAFFVGFFVGNFNSTHVTIIVGCMLVGSIILAPAIVFGYGVKAAIRHDAGESSGH